MHTYVLIASGRRCAIIWRPGKQTAHYWLTPSSWHRIQSITVQGQLVRVYADERTFLLQGGAA